MASKVESQESTLTTTEKAVLAIKLCSLASTTLLTLLLAPFRGQNGGPTLYRHVLYGALRRLSHRMSVAQMQYLTPQVDEVYIQFVKSKGLTPNTIITPEGVKARWLGSESATKVMLYFHGGGYVLSVTEDHWDLLWDIRQRLDQGTNNFSILFLEYSLAPWATYPRQLQEAVGLLNYTINVLQKHPSDIMLAGDSAGGNLALGVLSHISHPHAQVPKLELSQNLRGAVLISPWITLDCTAESMTRNKDKDVVTADTIIRWGKVFVNGAQRDFYHQALMAPVEWWSKLRVEGILIVAGSDEIMIDDIKAFATKLQKMHTATTLVVGAQEPHVAPVIYRLFKMKDYGEQDKAIMSWLSQRF